LIWVVPILVDNYARCEMEVDFGVIVETNWVIGGAVVVGRTSELKSRKGKFKSY
jgi:hypothetical protein